MRALIAVLALLCASTAYAAPRAPLTGEVALNGFQLDASFLVFGYETRAGKWRVVQGEMTRFEESCGNLYTETKIEVRPQGKGVFVLSLPGKPAEVCTVTSVHEGR